MTTIRLEHLCRQGVPDLAALDVDIHVDGSKYFELPLLNETQIDFGWDIVIPPHDEIQFEKAEPCLFSEITRYACEQYTAIKIPTPYFIEIGYGFTEAVNLYLVWVAREKVWIAFYFVNVIDPDESYGATVTVAYPVRSIIFRINNTAEKLIRKMFGNI